MAVRSELELENGTSPAATSTEKEEQSTSSQSDASPIDWDGPDDPEMPLNWPKSKRWINTMAVSTLTLLTFVFPEKLRPATSKSYADLTLRPFASSMIAPAVQLIMDDMGETNRNLGSFSVSIYLLGYAFGPLFLAPLSELYGRLPVYHICIFLFLLTNVACALSVKMPMFIIFRLLTGLVGACPLTLGPASVADCFRQEERGRAMAIWNMPVLLGPSLGPAVGAYVSRSLGWRWNFWLLVIMVRLCLNHLNLLVLTMVDGHCPSCLPLHSEGDSPSNFAKKEAKETAKVTRHAPGLFWPHFRQDEPAPEEKPRPSIEDALSFAHHLRTLPSNCYRLRNALPAVHHCL